MIGTINKNTTPAIENNCFTCFPHNNSSSLFPRIEKINTVISPTCETNSFDGYGHETVEE